MAMAKNEMVDYFKDSAPKRKVNVECYSGGPFDCNQASFRHYKHPVYTIMGQPYPLRVSGERPPDGLPQRYEAASGVSMSRQ